MKRLLMASIGTLLLAAGCGGGGGGSPAPQPPPVPTTPVAITANNQVTAASVAANVFVGVGGVAGAVPLASGDRVTAAAKGISFAPAAAVPHARTVASLLTQLSAIAVRAPAGALAAAKQAGQVAALAIIPLQPQPCPTSGNITGQLDDRDNSGSLTNGDAATLSFNACRDGSDTINGTVAVTFASVNASATQYSATMAFGNLSASTSEGAVALDGSLAIVYNELPNGNSTSTLTIGPSGLRSSVNAISPPYTDTLVLAAGLTIVETVDLFELPPGGGAAGSTTQTVNGSVASARLNGSISIATNTAVKVYEADLYPRIGQITLTGAPATAGAPSSRLVITAVNATSVRLQLDADGNGTFDDDRTVPWADII